MSNLFTRDELKMLTVVSDLLGKGEVETRIAKYMHEKKWNDRRVLKFLDKCLLSSEWYSRLWMAYRSYDGMPDHAQKLSDGLKQTFELELHT